MNALAEALGMSLTGCAAIPAPYRERGQIAYRTGLRIVDMAHEDLKPSQILTRDAFVNAIRVNSAIGGSTNAPIHLAAIARHAGVELLDQDWQLHGYDIPLLPMFSRRVLTWVRGFIAPVVCLRSCANCWKRENSMAIV